MKSLLSSANLSPTERRVIRQSVSEMAGGVATPGSSPSVRASRAPSSSEVGAMPGAAPSERRVQRLSKSSSPRFVTNPNQPAFVKGVRPARRSSSSAAKVERRTVVADPIEETRYAPIEALADVNDVELDPADADADADSHHSEQGYEPAPIENRPSRSGLDLGRPRRSSVSIEAIVPAQRVAVPRIPVGLPSSHRMQQHQQHPETGNSEETREYPSFPMVPAPTSDSNASAIARSAAERMMTRPSEPHFNFDTDTPPPMTMDPRRGGGGGAHYPFPTQPPSSQLHALEASRSSRHQRLSTDWNMTSGTYSSSVTSSGGPSIIEERPSKARTILLFLATIVIAADFALLTFWLTSPKWREDFGMKSQAVQLASAPPPSTDESAAPAAPIQAPDAPAAAPAASAPAAPGAASPSTPAASAAAPAEAPASEPATSGPKKVIDFEHRFQSARGQAAEEMKEPPPAPTWQSWGWGARK